MRAFRRRGQAATARLDPDEITLLTSLVSQLTELLTAEEPAQEAAADEAVRRADQAHDPFAAWEADLSADPDEPEVSADPVLRRLFPTAYPHDAAASSDFRRFTEREQRQRKLDDAAVVLAALTATDAGRRDVRVDPEQSTAWLRTLTALRLSVATRLGITDAESGEELADLAHDDPRAFMYSVYEWLGFAQDSLLRCL